MYDEKDKSVHLSLVPFFVIKLENARNMVRINLAEGGMVSKSLSAWPTEESVKEVKKASKTLMDYGKKGIINGYPKDPMKKKKAKK
jgi:hypothetical protein